MRRQGSGFASVAPHSAADRAFHWASAALLVSMFALAWTSDVLGPGTVAAQLVSLHRSIGLLLLGTVVVRLLWRATHPLPPLPVTVSVWERRLARSVQALLYAGLILMPLLGWAASDTAGDTVSFFGIATLPSLLPMDEDLSDWLFQLHGWTALGLLSLVGLHVVGALRHHFLLGDDVLTRMTGWTRRRPAEARR